MNETINLILTKFTDETITIFIAVLLFNFFILLMYYIYNKKKMQKLVHQIPAAVVKDYLDSIIQNSTALKSSLFRGGGLDVGAGTPSIVQLASLPVSSTISTGGQEELNQKNAEIASLRSIIEQKDRIIRELESKIRELESRPVGGDLEAKNTIASLNKKIEELTRELEKARSQSSGGDTEALTKECSALKERLQEYEIIEEDLANLKRLQQENERLKKALEGGGVAVAAAAVTSFAGSEETPSMTETAFEEPAVEEAAPQAAIENEDPLGVNIDTGTAAQEEESIGAAPEGEQKSAEELLSEFEKMLG